MKQFAVVLMIFACGSLQAAPEEQKTSKELDKLAAMMRCEGKNFDYDALTILDKKDLSQGETCFHLQYKPKKNVVINFFSTSIEKINSENGECVNNWIMLRGNYNKLLADLKSYLHKEPLVKSEEFSQDLSGIEYTEKATFTLDKKDNQLYEDSMGGLDIYRLKDKSKIILSGSGYCYFDPTYENSNNE